MKLETFFYRKGTTNFIFKFGSARRFDSRLSYLEEGVIDMQYFVKIKDSDKSVEIKRLFKQVALEYFKPLRYILVVENGYKVSKENSYLYEINFVAKVEGFERDKENLLKFKKDIEDKIVSWD